MKFEVLLTLVSDEITENLPAEWIQAWDQTVDLMNNHYFGAGGATAKLNPDLVDEFLESPFSDSQIDFDDEPPGIDEYGDGFNITEDTPLEDGSHDVTYQMMPQIELIVEANSEVDVKGVCEQYLFKLIDIWDVAADEVVGTAKIEIENIRKLES